ncbi:MAG: hypothetical protein ACFFBH_01430 [Promethearchaeota archaeon]
MASKAGSILAEVGVIILLASTLFIIQMNMYFGNWPPYDWKNSLSYIMTFIWGAGVISGIILANRGIKVGNYLILSFGTVALVGSFIPLEVHGFPPMFFNIIPLNLTFYYIDVILIIIGGILAVAIKGRD